MNWLIVGVKVKSEEIEFGEMNLVLDFVGSSLAATVRSVGVSDMRSPQATPL